VPFSCRITSYSTGGFYTIKKFQDQFEFPLTEVIGRKLYVTDFGEEIAIAAEKVLNEVEAINYKTLAYKGELSGL
jgi:DNA-binding transcriptional LysR family regulator